MAILDKKIIAVIGATGAQGGGLVRAILDDVDSTFAVRALTRDPTKQTAMDLEKAGAEVVAFDMDGSNPDSMTEALRDVYGLFVITNFWEHFDYMREMEQVRAVVKAGEMAGVQHYVWSTLEDTVPFFDSLQAEARPPKVNGTYVPHFDAKGQANALFPKEKTTVLYTSFYLENLYKFGQVNNGVFASNIGADTLLPVIAVEDIGKCTFGIFKAGTKYLGSEVRIASERMTLTELMFLASEVVGQKYSYMDINREAYANLGFPGADDLANMYEYMRLNAKYSHALDPKEAHALNPKIQSVRDFFKMHKAELLSVGPKMEQL